MKSLLTPLMMIALAVSASASPANKKVRTMESIRGIPTAGLASALPPKVYKRLAQEPVKAWIAVQGHVQKSRVVATNVIHSEANGVYDKAAMQIADGMELYSPLTESRIPSRVVVHILVYDLPKGEHAIAMVQDDSTAGVNGWLYSRSVRMRFLGLKQ
jgi:hypothetical protein